VVTALTVPLLTVPVLVAAAGPLADVLEDAAGAVPDAAVADAVLCAASAGSCPETSTSAINSHAATNNPTAPEITRRRIARARIARACRRPSASRLAARPSMPELMRVMVSFLVSVMGWQRG
jgi:hypothetical protein